MLEYVNFHFGALTTFVCVAERASGLQKLHVGAVVVVIWLELFTSYNYDLQYCHFQHLVLN